MHARVKGPRLRKIDVRIPERLAPFDGRTPLLDDGEQALLKRIDGQSTVNALASSMGLADADVGRSLAKMERLRLVTFLAQRRTASSLPPVRLRSGMRPALDTIPSVPDSPPANEAKEANEANEAGAASVEPATESPSRDAADPYAIDEAQGFILLQRTLVAAMCGRLGELSHYEVLGIPRTASSDMITRAYFVLVSAFHSQRFVQESIGVRRDHMDAVRAHATLAHETLASPSRRAVYDVLLFSLARTRDADGARENRSHLEARTTLMGIGPLPRGR